MKNLIKKMQVKQWVRRGIYLFVVMATTSTMFLSTAFAQTQNTQNEQKIAIIESSISKMKQPNTTAESLGDLSKGDVVIVLEEANQEDGWHLVTMNDQKFFVPANQVKIISTQETFSEPIRGRVKVDGVNLRSKPSVDAQIVCILKKGTLVDATQKIGNWYKISTGKTFGYVSCEYLDMFQVEAEPIYLTLNMGTSGTEVKRLQETLSMKGYAIDNINGAYGAKTRDAVKQFQQDNYLTADGIAHIETQVLLYQEESAK